MGLFGLSKKKETPTGGDSSRSAKTKEYRVMIEVGTPGGSNIPPKKEWSVSGQYIAYRELGGRLVEKEGAFRFENCTEERMRELMAKIKQYSVMHVAADLNGTFNIKELLQTDVTPLEDEAALFERNKIPITFNHAQFGEFVFDRRLNWFGGTIEFHGQKISVSLFSEEDIKILRFICKDLDEFVEQASRYAAENLLELGNQWQYDDCGEEDSFVPMTEDDFVKRVSLNGITIEDVEGGDEYTL